MKILIFNYLNLFVIHLYLFIQILIIHLLKMIKEKLLFQKMKEIKKRMN